MKLIVNKHQFPEGTKLIGTPLCERKFGFRDLIVLRYEVSCNADSIKRCKCRSYGETIIDSKEIRHCIFYPLSDEPESGEPLWEKEKEE